MTAPEFIGEVALNDFCTKLTELCTRHGVTLVGTEEEYRLLLCEAKNEKLTWCAESPSVDDRGDAIMSMWVETVTPPAQWTAQLPVIDVAELIENRHRTSEEDAPTDAAQATVGEMLSEAELITAEDGRGLIVALSIGSGRFITIHIDGDGAVSPDVGIFCQESKP